MMGSADETPAGHDSAKREALARRLGGAIAGRGCVLVTGATTGVPNLVSRSVRESGGLAVGISPGANAQEHVGAYGLPADAADVIVYTGFGKKGRNVINVRSSDIVIVIGGGLGTLNEFTVAYDEGKTIGVLEGSGGVADRIRELLEYLNKAAGPRVIFMDDPETLIDACIREFERGRVATSL